MNTTNSQFLTFIFCILSSFAVAFGAELDMTMQLLSASKVKKENQVKTIQEAYDSALRTKNFDAEKLKQIKQLLFSAKDELLVAEKKIAEEYLRRKLDKRTEK